MSRITIHDATFFLAGLCLGRMSYRWGWTIVAAVAGVAAWLIILARLRERRRHAQFVAEMKWPAWRRGSSYWRACGNDGGTRSSTGE